MQARPTLYRDLIAGLIVFLVAIPLCLGLALASGAPLISGVLAGVVGGLIVGLLSGSDTSVSGPAAGLVAIVATQIETLNSFSAILLATVLAGMIQIGLGAARAGFIASFFPTSVVKGLLTAIGLILILKQIPHMFGHDPDPEGEMAFFQPDRENTFSEIFRLLGDLHPGAAVVGVLSIATLILWERRSRPNGSAVHAPLFVVLLGVILKFVFDRIGGDWAIGSSHLVQVPTAETFSGFLKDLEGPDFSRWSDPAVLRAALMIAAVASLETLLNLQAIDKIDPLRRTSPPSRELLAQGVGNVVSGLIGGMPVTAVVVRSSVGINAGARTKLSTVFHGGLLLVCVVTLPDWLNLIPLSCLASILLVTGFHLINFSQAKQLWKEGRPQFVPYAATVTMIVLTDLLIGVLAGMAVSVAFILHGNVRRPTRRFVEKHLGGDVLHIELADQVSFLNRAALSKILDELPRGGHVLLDAKNTDYFDPDILGLIREFKDQIAPARGVSVSLVGFRDEYRLRDEIQYVDYSTRELQSAMTPLQVLQILKDGHERFRTGRRLTRDLGRQVTAAAASQHPLAVVLSCIDSRTPAELIFDLGVGDILSVRVAGNVISRKVLASIEYGCVVVGAKLVLVMGHTRCGAVGSAVKLLGETRSAEITGCQHIDHIIADIQESAEPLKHRKLSTPSASEMESLVDAVARRNVLRSVELMRSRSDTLDTFVRDRRVMIVGAMYNVADGAIEFLTGPEPDEA